MNTAAAKRMATFNPGKKTFFVMRCLNIRVIVFL